VNVPRELPQRRREDHVSEQIVRNLSPFRRFLGVAAQSNTEVISYRDIVRAINSDPKTISGSYDILATFFWLERGLSSPLTAGRVVALVVGGAEAPRSKERACLALRDKAYKPSSFGWSANFLVRLLLAGS
jgi:hypothetical protein